jgi:predicted HAD superfamily phosphohydrolase YqeG
MEEMGSDRTNTVVLGDQLLTDALAGKHIGLRAVIVPPIRDKKTAFFRFKRWCEKPFIKRFKRKNHIEW